MGAEQKELEKANELQKQMIDVIDKNNKITSGHNRLMLVLTAVIVLLTIFTLGNKTGQYAISVAGSNAVYVLDIKTSQLWLRTAGGISFDLGTNKNPKMEAHRSDELQKKIDESKNNE